MSLTLVNGNFTVPVLPPGQAWIDIRNTYGALSIGVNVSMCLLGITTLQAWYYYNSFPNDAAWMKAMVVALCFIEYLRGAFLGHAMYYYLILNWGNPLGLKSIAWSSRSVIVLTCVGEFFARICFTWRIFVLSRTRTLRLLLTSTASILAFTSLGMAFAASVALVKAENLTEYSIGSDTRLLVPLAFASNASSDIAITASMVFLLHRNRTGHSRTNRIVNAIILYVVQAGAITIIIDILCLAFSETLGLTYMATYVCVGNLYANSLLANLNMRVAVSKLNDGTDVLSSINAQSVSSETHQLSSIKHNHPVRSYLTEDGLYASNKSSAD